jgi:4-amino-4-deoxy-L-arabinose transferase-like glycosyltransferase
VLILQGTLVFHGSMTLSPDAPLVPLGLLVALLTVRALEGEGLMAWIGLGLMLGLAGLAKYTAVTLAVSVVLLVLLRSGWRGLLQPGLWLAGGFTVLLVSPVIWWNWQHDWATVAFHSDYQFEDVERWSLPEFLFSLAEQVVFYSPLLVIGGLLALYRLRFALRVREGRQRRDVLLIAFVIPVLGIYLFTALESRASPHWSMLGWILLIPVLANWLVLHWQESRGLRVLGWLSGSYSVVVLVGLLVLAVPWGTWPEFKHPSKLMMGWKAASQHGDELRQRIPRRDFATPPVLLARNWHHAGLLAWYAPEAGVRNLFLDLNPHNLENGYPDHDTWGVLVYPRASHEPRGKDLTRDFDCTPIDATPAFFGDSLVQVFHYYACYSKLPAAPD